MIKKIFLPLLLVLLTSTFIGLIDIGHASAATYTVTSNANAGAGTLRQAITDANASVGVTDTIEFAIGTGQQSIAPTAVLPTISDPLIIDGTTQPGGATCGTNFTNRNLLVEINGTNIGDQTLLTFDTGSDGSTIKGLVINRAGLTNPGLLMQNSNDHIVQCNNIGTNFAGTTGLNSQKAGVVANTVSNLLVGGTGAGEGNIISGNAGNPGGGDGYRGTTTNLVFQGNYVGVGANGECIGNGDGQGVGVTGSNNTVGGNTSAARNVISCHSGPSGSAVDLVGGFGTPSTGNKFQGNYIGTNINGTVESGYGNNAFVIVGDAQDNMIGGVGAGEGNIIAGNKAGILNLSFGAFLSVNNSILGNKIYDNVGGVLTSLGIDNVQTDDFVTYTNLGVTLNDANDIDYNNSNTGTNHYLNFPVINSITSSNGQVTINYDLDINDAEAGATGYRVEFFANDASDPSGYGEGQTFLGYQNVAGDVTGQSVTFTLPAGQVGNKFVSATTTMIDSSTDGFGHTSEFGALVESNFVPTGSVTPSPATLASTGDNSHLLVYYSVALITISTVAAAFVLRRHNNKSKLS